MNASLAPTPVPSSALEADYYNVILPWLHHLRCIFPISRALVVGAGSGYDPWVGFLKKTATDAVTLVEADEVCFQQLQRATADRTTWTLCHQLIAPDRGRATFHRTTVPCENGLLDAPALKNLWPRLVTRESIDLHAITLADVMDGLPTPADWLFIDCLPALPILRGADDHLDKIKVIVARLVRKPCGNMQMDCTMEPLVEALCAMGFQLLSIEANRNPVTGHALFIRDPAIAAQTLHTLRNEIVEQQARLNQMESKQKIAQLRSAELSALIASFESTIATLQDSFARANEENIRLSRKVITLTSHMSLLASFLAKGNKNQKHFTHE